MYILLAKIFIESVHEICEIQCYLYGTVAGVVIFVREGNTHPLLTYSKFTWKSNCRKYCLNV